MSSSSIDPQEVEFYQKLAARWWDPDGPFRPLHRMNALRVAYLRDRLITHFRLDPAAERPLQGLRILDIGCGGGILSEAIAGLGADVHGVDVAERNILTARLHAAESGLAIRYEVASAEMLACRGELYHAVMNMEVVEHVAELRLFLNACMRVVRPGGLMFVATINRTLMSYLGAIVMAEYIMRWLPRGTHQWQRFPTPLELENILAEGGFRVAHCTGVGMNPFTMKFRLSRYLGINYLLTTVREFPDRL